MEMTSGRLRAPRFGHGIAWNPLLRTHAFRSPHAGFAPQKIFLRALNHKVLRNTPTVTNRFSPDRTKAIAQRENRREHARIRISKTATTSGICGRCNVGRLIGACMSDVRHWVLVVENDAAFRDGILMPGLRNAGFDAVGVGAAVDAYRCMLSRRFSLFVLGAGLQDEHGSTMVRRLRSVTGAGIVVLAQRRRKSEQIRSLNDGADAYLARTIDIDALAATLRSLLRRLKPADASAGPNKRAPEWRLGTAGWDLISPGGAKVQLNQPERLLMGALAAASGKAVTREAIISLLARDARNFDRHRLEMLVHRLRRKVLSATGEPLPLKAVRGVGYALLP